MVIIATQAKKHGAMLQMATQAVLAQTTITAAVTTAHQIPLLELEIVATPLNKHVAFKERHGLPQTAVAITT